ncbi:MAG: Holliday junction resolvase RecU [Lachnospiraceae bacterium]|nr:Holliday junction resolvase RecU [Lachnospiraceae bacterium]
MATWNSRGLRGSVLEEMINYTNQKYRDKKLALIQKIPTPITPVRFDKNTRHITLAYFEQKSTVDYIGAVQGIPVCFDAKECAVDTFPLQNIHPHQVEFMKAYEEQGGISFLLIYYSHRQECYYLRFAEMMKYWERMNDGGQKNFKHGELDEGYFVPSGGGVALHYLVNLQKDLEERNQKDKRE